MTAPTTWPCEYGQHDWVILPPPASGLWHVMLSIDGGVTWEGCVICHDCLTQVERRMATDPDPLFVLRRHAELRRTPGTGWENEA